MNSLVLLLICLAVLLAGYVFYGGWLAKKWGVGEGNDETPAHTMSDGVDYVPAKAPVLMGHHFSSIAGAGPITGPIAATIFGWIPVTLWVLIGGIFFGGVHDFGALFASIKHKGQSIGEIINTNVGRKAKRLFTLFAYLTLILVVAAFASIVAGTFKATFKEVEKKTSVEAALIVENDAIDNDMGDAENDSGGENLLVEEKSVEYVKIVDKEASAANASVAMVSILFIVVAILFGFAVYRRGVSMLVSSLVGIVAIIACLVIGMRFHPIYLDEKAWMIIIGVYIAVASITPVWILLQPRDYLSSFLLYAMLFISLVGIIGAHPSLSAVDPKTGKVFLPAFTGFKVFTSNGMQYMFPILFTTVACGAISGFHSLVASGTTSKQLDREKDAKPIAYGGMLLECVLAVVTICAVAYARQTGHTKGVTDIFAGGVAAMVAKIPGCARLESSLYTLLVLTYSAFCLTSLDTASRLARFMFQEFWLEQGETVKDVKSGWRKIMVNPYFATVVTVVCGIGLGMTGYGKIWGLFGAANQLLAGIGLLAVAVWLGNIGKNNKMFLFPMGFMIVVTISSLAITAMNQIRIIEKGGAGWGPYAQVVLALFMMVLAIILVIEGIKTLITPKKI